MICCQICVLVTRPQRQDVYRVTCHEHCCPGWPPLAPPPPPQHAEVATDVAVAAAGAAAVIGRLGSDTISASLEDLR